MFVLAHISDPHLAPLPRPHWSELVGKRATGFFNWRRSRRFIHRADVLARVTADLRASAADHIAITGDLVDYVRGAAPHFRSHWGEFMRDDDITKIGFPIVRRRGPLALIGLSSA